MLAFLKQNGLKIQVTTDGRNASVLEQVIHKGLTDSVILEVRGPVELYEKRTGASIDQDELSKSFTLAAKCMAYQLHTEVTPLEREDGTLNDLTSQVVFGFPSN